MNTETNRRPDRVTRLLQVIGICDEIERQRFNDANAELIDYLHYQLADATRQLTANDRQRIRGYAVQAIQSARRQVQFWAEIDAEIANA